LLELLGGIDLRRGRVGDVDGGGHRDLPVEQLVDPQAGIGPPQRTADIRLGEQRPAVRPGPVCGPAEHPVIQTGEPASRAEHHPFVVELSGHQPPAGVLLPDPHRDRNPHVGIVGRVDVVRTVVRDDRRPGEPGIAGVDDQDGDAFVARRVRVGTAGQPDVVGVVGTGGENLLPIDQVAVAVPDGPGAQCRQVGARPWLGVADGEMHVPGQDPRQEELLLLRGAVSLQCRADGLQGDGGQRHVGAGRLTDEDLLFHLAKAAPTVLGGPAHAEPPVAAHPAHNVLVDGAVPLGEHRGAFVRRDKPGEVGPQLVA
jgi:hypothetical protein